MSKARIEIRADIPVIVFSCGGCRPCGHAEYEIIKELEAEKAELMLYAENLWRSNRPLSYSEKDHLENPFINIRKDSEKELIKIYLKQKYKTGE